MTATLKTAGYALWIVKATVAFLGLCIALVLIGLASLYS